MPDPTTSPTTEPSTISLEILTDEELSVLTPRTVVVQPVLDDVAPEHRDVVRGTAFRSLMARGIIDPPSPEAIASALRGAAGGADGDVGVELRVRNDVLSALTLRQSASAVVAVARTTATGQDFWYAHLVEEIALLEEVGTDGLHRFALGHARDLPALLAGATLHPDAVAGAGAVVELAAAPESEAPVELLEHLGQAYLRSDVIVVTRDGEAPAALPTLTGLYTGPLGSWSIEAKEGSQRAWARPETVEAITARVAAIAAAARDHAPVSAS